MAKIKTTKPKKFVPFEFVLEELDRVSPYIKPMFGAYGVYVGEKIIFILRDRPKHPDDNGIWLATSSEHHDSLSREFPNMRSIKIFGPGPSAWQNLPSESDDFEEAALNACNLVLQGDPRIGKIPKSKLKKATPKKIQPPKKKKTKKL